MIWNGVLLDGTILAGIYSDMEWSTVGWYYTGIYSDMEWSTVGWYYTQGCRIGAMTPFTAPRNASGRRCFFRRHYNNMYIHVL